MKIIEICEQPKNVVWNNDKTFLCVFDKNGNQIADYDFFSGLRLLLDENTIKVFIFDKDLVPGKWKFFGVITTQKNNKIIEKRIFFEGIKTGKIFKRKYENKNPWNYHGGTITEYVSAKEREDRMDICRRCPLFNKIDGTCSVNGNLVIATTKRKYDYCPEEKWGNKSEAIRHYSQDLSEEMIQNIKTKNITSLNDQEKFEAEFEEYLKGK